MGNFEEHFRHASKTHSQTLPGNPA